jgi:Fungal Zn(2)-Cys(6) binuclear cluster domain
MPQSKRRGALRQRKAGEESESESEDDHSAEADDPSLSPQVSSLSVSRRSSNADTSKGDIYVPSSSAPPERYREGPEVPSRSLRSEPTVTRRSPEGSRNYFNDNELPHIATLSVPTSSPSSSMPGPQLPPIRPASEQQAAQRKRAATVPGKSTRQPSSSGPKVVACNFCRCNNFKIFWKTTHVLIVLSLARKTKCDGAHPACSSCSRRSLPCSYVHDAASSNGSTAKKTSRRASTSKIGSAPSASSRSPSSQLTRVVSAPSNEPNGYGQQDPAKDAVVDLKRTREDSERGQPPKKMRMDDSPPIVGIP